MNHNIWRRWITQLFQRRISKRVRTRRLTFERLEDRVVPASNNWTGGGAAINLDWSNGANWSLGTPVAGQDLVFGSSAPTVDRATFDNMTLAAGTGFNSITISATGYSITGSTSSIVIPLVGALNVGSNLGVASGLGNEPTIAANIQFVPPLTNPEQTITVNGGSTLDLQGQLTGSGTPLQIAEQTLLVEGPGTLQLDANNSAWTGAFSITNGATVTVTNSDALGLGVAVSGAPNAGTATIEPLAELELDPALAPAPAPASLTVPENLIINGTGVGNDGALFNETGDNIYSGDIAMATATTFGTNPNFQNAIATPNTLTIGTQVGGIISDLGSPQNLTTTGEGTIVFAHPGGNTYRGTTTINNGILEIEDPLSLGAGANSSTAQSGTPQAETIVNYNATTGQAGTLELNFVSSLGSNDTGDVDPNGILTNPALSFNAATNPYVGFQVFNDLLVLNGPGFNPVTPNNDVFPGFNAPTTNNLGALYNLSGDNGWDGNIILGSVTSSNPFNVLIGVNANTATVSNPNSNLTISGVISNPTFPAISPVKIGQGRLILTNVNTYASDTFVETGELQITDSSALGPNSNEVWVVNGASLEMAVDSGLDGTTLSTHNRNLGDDSVTGYGQGQEVYVSGSSGSFTLTFDNGINTDVTVGLNVADPNLALDMQNALNALPGFNTDNVTVTQDGDIYRVTGGYLTQTGGGANNLLMTPTITAGNTGMPTVVVNPIYGLNVSYTLNEYGDGASALGGSPEGALDSLSGINIYSGTIFLGDHAVGLQTGSIGVLPDGAFTGFAGEFTTSRMGHPTADDNYIQWDYSLTATDVENEVAGGFTWESNLYKYGGGQLILPNANSYGWSGITGSADLIDPTTGLSDPSTTVWGGWITIENIDAFGPDLSPSIEVSLTTNPVTDTNGFVPQANGVTVQVMDGASVQLDPQGNASWDVYYNWILQGTGIDQPFSSIDQGALESMAGDNVLAGFIQLDGMAGIGVEQVQPTAVTPALTASQVTITDEIENNGPNVGGLVKLGSRRLIIQGPGSYSGSVVIAAGVLLDQSNTGLGAGNTLSTANAPTVTVDAGAALELANDITSQNGGLNGGLEIWGEDLILNGSGDPTFGDTALTILGGNTPTGGTVDTLTMTGSVAGGFFLSFGGQTTAEISGAATADQVQAALDALSTIGESGGSVNVFQSVNGNTNVYTITFGGSLIDTSTQLETTDSFTPVSSVAVVPVPTFGNFSLTFNGKTTTSLSASATATQVQQALTNILSTGQSVLVGQSGNAYTITFGGSLAGTTLPIGIFTGGTDPDENYAQTTVPIVQVGAATAEGVSVTTGSFFLSFAGATTGPFSSATTAAQLQTALDALSTIGGANGSVAVAGSGGNYTITFGGSLINTSTPLAVTNTDSLAPSNSVVTLPEVLTGTFTLTFDGATTSLTAPATGNQVENALNNLSTINGVGGSVNVSLNSGVYTITFSGGLAGTTLPIQLATVTNAVGTRAITTTVMPFLDTLFPTDDLWDGNVTLDTSATITVQTNPEASQPDSRLVINGNIGAPAPADSNLTLVGGGELDLDGVDSYGGSTFIDQGVMSIGSNQALGGDPVSEVQTLDLSSLTAGTPFTLTFTPYIGASATTPTLTYTGTAADTATIQNALNALSTIGGVGSTTDSGGVVTVKETNPGVYQITYGGMLTGFQQNPLQATAGLNTFTAVDDISGDTVGGGGTVVANGASLQLSGSFTVAGEPLLVEGNGDGTLSIPTQWFQVGPAGSTGGQAGTAGNQGSNNNNNVSGQVTGIVTDPNNSNVIYIATAGGGAWKTVDGGLIWRPIFDSIPEIQAVGAPASSSFTLSFTNNGVTDTTSPLSGNDPNLVSDMETALNDLANIGGAGGVVSVAQNGNSYSVTFAGTLAGLALNQMTTTTVAGSSASVSTVEVGTDNSFALYVGAIAMDPGNDNTLYVGTGLTNNSSSSYYGTGIYESQDDGVTWQLLTGNESQQVTLQGQGTEIQQVSIQGMGLEEQQFTVSGTKGSYTLTIAGQTTADIAFNATSATVQAAIQAALNAIPAPNAGEFGPVLVQGGITGPGTYDVYFYDGIDPQKNVPLMTGAKTGTAASSAAPGGFSELQTVGEFQIAFGGQMTVPLPYDASDSEIQAALNNLLTDNPSLTGYGPVVVAPETPSVPPQTIQNAPVPVVQTFTTQGVTGTAGDFTLTWNGQTTGNIAYNASAATIQAALAGLAIPPDATVTQTVTALSPTTNLYTNTITFTSAESYFQQPLLFTVAQSVAGDTISPITAPTSNVQTFTSSGPTGGFFLTYDGQTTAEIAFNATAATVQTDLNNLLNAANTVANNVTATVTRAVGSPIAGIDTYTVTTSQPITFSVSTVGGDAVTGPTIVSQVGGESFNVIFDDSGGNTTGIPALSVINGTAPNAITNEASNVAVIQSLGTYTLTYNGQTTPTLPYNASIAQIEAALNTAIADSGVVGGSVTVTQTPITDEQWFQSYGGAGTFTLTIADPTSKAAFTTAPIAFNASAATVLTAITTADPNLTNNISVQLDGNAYYISFSGSLTSETGKFANTDVAQLPIIVAAQGGDEVTSVNNPNATGPTTGGGDLLEKTAGGEILNITFGGSLAGSPNVTTMTATGSPNFVASNVTVTQPFNPLYGKGVSALVAESNGTLYVASADSVPGTDQVQAFTFNGFTGGEAFTLSFSGADATGAIVTDTTPTLQFGMVNLLQVIQNDLDALTNIGGIGGQVLVGSNNNGNTFTVTFEGSLSDRTVATITTSAATTGSPSIALAITTQGTSPQAVNGLSGPTDESQSIAFNGFNANDQFALSFTAPDSTGELVTDTTPNIPYGEPFTNPLTGAAYTGNLAIAEEIQYYLDLLPNIGGVGGNVVVTLLTNPLANGATVQVTFEDSLSDTPFAAMTSTKTSNGTIAIAVTTVGNQVVSGLGGAPGIWEFSPAGANPAVWTNLTGSVAATSSRTATVSANGADTVYGPSATTPAGFPGQLAPGPDDDFYVTFPQYQVTWSDVAVVSIGGGNAIIFAALGTADGSPDNGVFWAEVSTTSNSVPIWYAGNPFSGSPLTVTADNESGIFPTGAAGNAVNGNIKISATLDIPTTSPQVDQEIFVYASIAQPDGQLLSIYEGTWAQTNPLGTLPGEMNWAAVGLPSNYMSDQGFYDSAIAVNPVNSAQVFVGGTVSSISDQTGQIFESTNSGGSWTDISLDSNENGPHTSQQFMVIGGYVDTQTNTLYGGSLFVGGDGGIWNYNYAGGPPLWSNLNGDLAISQVDGVASNPTDINSLIAGIQSNGLSQFNDDQIWAMTQSAGSGEVGGGQVYVDPNNPENMYIVQSQFGANAIVEASNNGGITWTVISPAGLTAGTSPTGVAEQLLPSPIPLVMDSINPDRLLVGGGASTIPALWESINQGQTWTNLLPPINVTQIAISQYQGAFVPDTKFPDVTDQGTDSYDSNTIYVTDGTSIYLTKDNGLTWVNRSISNSFPDNQIGTIVNLVVDPRNRDTVYAVTQDSQAGAIATGEIWMSTNAGQTWTLIAGASSEPIVGTGALPVVPTTTGLPNVPAWSLAIDPRNGNVYLGNDLGVYELNDGAALTAPGIVAIPTGGTWERVGTGLPNVQVRDLVLNLQTNTLLAGTYGRSVYELFLDAQQIALNEAPVQAAVIGLSGQSFWTGPVIIAGDPIANTVTFGSDGAQDLPNEFAAASIDFVGPIGDLTGGSNPTLDKDGGGDIVFSGDNIYGGYTNVEAGVLIADNLDALGAFSDPLVDGTTVDDGATLALEANLDAETVTLIGDGNSFDGHFDGSLLNISGNNTFFGNVILNTSGVNDSVTVGADPGSELTLTGSITGGDSTSNDADTTFRFVKEGTGTITIDNSSADTYVAITDVYQGALNLQTTTAVANGIGTINVLDGAQLQVQTPVGGSSVTFTNPLSLSGTGIFGTGALLDTGGNNSWVGPILFTIFPGFSPDTTPLGLVGIGVTNAGDVLTLGTPTTADEIAQAATNLTLGLLKVGAGTLAIPSATTYGGQTEVEDGILLVQNPNALGSRNALAPQNTIQQIVTVSDTEEGTFSIDFDGEIASNIPLGVGATTLASRIDTLLTNGANADLFASGGSVSVTETEVETTTEDDGPSFSSPTVSDVYTVTFEGGLAETNIPLEVSGLNGITAAASFVAEGATAGVATDVLVDTGAQVELDNSQLTTPGPLNVDYNLTLNGDGVNGDGALYNAIGDNAWSGPFAVATPSQVGVATGTTLTFTNSGSSVVASDYLQMIGPSQLIFSNTSTYTGQTQITAGDVQVDGTIGNVLLDGGTLSGTGTVGLITSTANGGTIDTGDNSSANPIGILTSHGSNTLTNPQDVLIPSDTIDADIGPFSSTPNADQLNITHASINLGDATFTGNIDPSVVAGQSFILIKTDFATDPADAITGTFAGASTTSVVPVDPSGSGLTPYATTIDWIDNEKFVIDYFSDEVVVTRELAIVTMTLTPSVANPIYGQDEQFIATLTPEQFAPPVTGIVVFVVNGASYPVTINPTNGIATLDLPQLSEPLAVGTYTVIASYDGRNSSGILTYNPVDNLAMTPSPTVTVAQTPTSIALAATNVALISGQNVTLTATVTTQLQSPIAGTVAPGDPSGGGATVAFYDSSSGSPVLLADGTLSISNGTLTLTATFSTTSLSVGSHFITAVFSGDDNYLGVTSSQITLVVSQSQTTTTLTALPASSMGSPLDYGEGVTFTATVAPVSPGGGTPTGTVSFKRILSGGVSIFLGTATLSGGMATFNVTPGELPLAISGETVTATYNGDGVPDDFLTSSGSIAVYVGRDATTTTLLASSPAPSVYGQPVTFTAAVAAVSPGGGTPTGTVEFFLNGSPTPMGTGTLSVVDGVDEASYTTSSFQLPVGAQSITASYSGDVDFINSNTTASLTQTVDMAATTTTVSSLVNPSVYGQPVTFTAAVAAVSPGAGTPTGTVEFFLNGSTTPMGTGTLSVVGGVDEASFTTTAFQLTVGSSNIITASYSGDVDFINSNTTTSLTQTVDMAATTTTVNSLVNPSVYGQPVTFTAAVAAVSPGAGTPTGTVEFFLNGSTTPLGTGTLSVVGGVDEASITTTAFQLPVGAQSITATYSGDVDFINSSTTTSLTQTVNKDSTATTVGSTGSSVYGQPVTFTATVTANSPGAGNPTGLVTFSIIEGGNSVELGTGTLSPSTGNTSTASYTTIGVQLPVGTNQTIVAAYGGDVDFTGNSGTISQTVGQATSSTIISSSAPSVSYGQPVTFTATVAAVSPGSGTPTGTVTFEDGTTILGTGTLSTTDGVTTATYTTSSFQLPVGTVNLPTSQTITAVYGGDGNFKSSTSSGLPQTITLASSTTTVNTSGPSVYGQPVTFTATVEPIVSGGSLPSGTVTFYVTVGSTLVPLGSGTLSTTLGVTTASYTTTAGQLPVGTSETITAIYSGDARYATSTGTTTQTVSQDSTSTLVTSSGSVLPGQSVTFTAEVTANSPGAGNATGTVSFMAGSTSLGSATLSTTNGVTTAQITVPWSELVVGVDTITATYSGDNNFLGSNGSMTESVEDETTTTVTTSLPTSVAGEPVTLTATITPVIAASESPTGTVTFTLGGTTLGTAIVGTVAGQTTAVLTLSSLPVGTKETIDASYSGDSVFIGSMGTVSQTVSKASTKTSLSSTANIIILGTTVVFTAQVMPVAPGAGVPTGTVAFRNGAGVMGTAPLINGVATFQRTLGGVAIDSITAVYTGDANDLASVSPVMKVAVLAPGARASKVTLTSSANPSFIGESVTFTATVKDAGGGAVHTPTGTVSFFDGTSLMGYGTLSTTGGVTTATFTTATLPEGTSSIFAAYNGNNGLFAHAVSAAITQTVTAVPVRASSITLSASSKTSTFGVPITFSATVTDKGSGTAQTPTGTVTFTAINTVTSTVINMGSGTLSGANGIATATLNFATLPLGTYTVTATYGGDGVFTSEISSPITQTVTEGSTAVVLTSSLPSGSIYSQAVTFTAAVSIPNSTVVPTGSVDFVNETTGIDYGTFPINSSGVATLKTAAMIAGDDIIQATYTGSPSSGTSSATIDQIVNQGTTKVALTSSANSNSPVTMTATVTAVSPSTGVPTGAVSFYIDGAFVGAGNVNSSGQATFTYSAGVSAGKHTVEAVYSGDVNFLSSNLTETINFVVGRGT